MGYQETWSLPLQRIEEYLLSQNGMEKIGENHYRFGTCDIVLTALPHGAIGPIPVPRTLVEFAGEGKDTQIIHRRFTLRFVSAGG